MTAWAPSQIRLVALGPSVQGSPVNPEPDPSLTERLQAAYHDGGDRGIEARFWTRREQEPIEDHAIAVREAPPAQREVEPSPGPAPWPARSPAGFGRAAVEAAFAGSAGLDWALRVAGCESGFDPDARNLYSGAAGLFQFLASTWQSTPFAGASVFGAPANAQAARWMYDHGRANEWRCP